MLKPAEQVTYRFAQERGAGSLRQRKFPYYFHIVYYARQRNTIWTGKRKKILQIMHDDRRNPAIIINIMMILSEKKQRKCLFERRKTEYLQVRMRL
jgi:hypothetical protein